MKNLLIAILITSVSIALVLYGYQQEGSQSAVFVIAALLVFGFGVVRGYAENIRASVWMLASGWGTYWAVGKMVGTIDFDAPFFTSFYWSTVGYFLLALVLLIVTLLLFGVSCQKPDRI